MRFINIYFLVVCKKLGIIIGSEFFIFRSREPAFRYIFFVIANEVKQSVELISAMSKKDAAAKRSLDDSN
ncbi:hypothetical protein [Epilithonimonas hominis]|uniref:hypothetical protein n=1 Tax=Epilithonimonas hominis TaxID=420404 RepID=UPI00289D618D|nr:hypothetical protein [Epilithonimonas hominis]